MNKYFTLMMVLIVGTFLVACGKKGGVEPLEDSKYPRTYPKPPEPDTLSSKKPETKGCCEDE
jgi:predicted small lipoprotein YifL